MDFNRRRHNWDTVSQHLYGFFHRKWLGAIRDIAFAIPSTVNVIVNRKVEELIPKTIQYTTQYVQTDNRSSLYKTIVTKNKVVRFNLNI